MPRPFARLLRELNALKGDFWIRLLYTHPAHWTDELISTIAECPKVARYVDIPLQHIHENMLERMRRETSQQYIVDLLRENPRRGAGHYPADDVHRRFSRRNRSQLQHAAGFHPRRRNSSGSGVFAYSKEDGTRAGAMTGQIPDQVKQQRRKLAMAAQHKIARQVSESFVGRTLKVLIEGKANEKQLQQANVSSWEHGLVREAEIRNPQSAIRNYLVGRGEADAPDIDGRVYVRGKVPVGEFARVKIIGHTDYDLIAEPV